MTILIPAWLQAGQYNAEVDRMVPAGLLTPNGVFSVRSGVRRWNGDELQVIATSPATMQVTINAGIAWIQGGYTSTQGVYCVVNDAPVTMPIVAASASNPRYDLVVLEVLDSGYSGSSNTAQLRVVQGTAAATPVAPSVTGNYIILAQVLVAKSAVSISSSAISDARLFTAANGGIIPVRDQWVRQSMTGITRGTVTYEVATGRFYAFGGQGWEYIYGGSAPLISVSPSHGWFNWGPYRGGGWEELRVSKSNGVVSVSGVLGNWSWFRHSDRMFTLPTGYRPERHLMRSCFTGSEHAVRLDISTDGDVRAVPDEWHRSGDYWAVDFSFRISNHTVG